MAPLYKIMLWKESLLLVHVMNRSLFLYSCALSHMETLLQLFFSLSPFFCVSYCLVTVLLYHNSLPLPYVQWKILKDVTYLNLSWILCLSFFLQGTSKVKMCCWKTIWQLALLTLGWRWSLRLASLQVIPTDRWGWWLNWKEKESCPVFSKHGIPGLNWSKITVVVI